MVNPHTRHMGLMLLACLLPLLLVLFLPVIGIKSTYIPFIAIGLMILAHAWMMRNPSHTKEGHSAATDHELSNRQNKKRHGGCH